MRMSFDDIKRNVSIIEMAERYGYQIQKGSGTRTPTMKNEATGDKICIFNPTDSYTQRYFNVKNDSDKGNLWDFVKYRLEMGLIPNPSSFSVAADINKCVMAVLYDYLNIPLEEREQSKEHIKELQKNQEKPVEDFSPFFAPLEKAEFLHARGFSDKVITDPLFQGKIGNVTGKYDIALPIFNGEDKMVGLEKRNVGLKLFVAGSQKGTGVWHSNVPSVIDRVLITESPLDCIAYHQMMPNPNTFYIAHGGNLCKGQIDTINALLSTHKGKVNLQKFEFLLGADNDEAGVGYDLAIIKNQLCAKGMRIEANNAADYKTLTIHEGAYLGFDQFLDNFSRNLKSKTVFFMPRAGEEGSYMKITYPAANTLSERELCQAILSTQVLPFTRLEKAVMKDWNEDLKQLKELSRQLKRYVTHEEFAGKYNGDKLNIISNKKSKGLKL